jgi:hypothetical protein
VARQPLGDLLIAGSGGDKLLEGLHAQPVCVEPAKVKGTGKVVVSVDAQQCGPAFVQGSGCAFDRAQKLGWAPRLAVSQVGRERAQAFEVWGGHIGGREWTLRQLLGQGGIANVDFGT